MGIGYELRRGGLKKLPLARGGWRRLLGLGTKDEYVAMEVNAQDIYA